nr:GNAT family N-acetyltransferase [Actinomycetota bacterium]
GAPDLDFVNRIECLGPAEADRFGAVLAFYGDLGLRPWLEPRPGLELDLSPSALTGLQTVLYARPRDAEPSLSVREADDLGARLVLEGLGVPPQVVEHHAPALAAATTRTGGRTYVAEVDGRAVGAGILTMSAGVGYLALAATLPAFRGRGCQSALIAARIAAAAAEGCELVVATAEFASISQRNLERAGLRVAYTKPVLRLTPPAGARSRAATA